MTIEECVLPPVEEKVFDIDAYPVLETVLYLQVAFSSVDRESVA